MKPAARPALATLGADAAGSWAAEQPTPISLLDRVLSLLRRASLEQWLWGVAAPLPLAAAVLGAYYLERVEGVRAPLPVFGLGCALAYVFRFARLSRLARELTALLAPGLPLTAAAPRALELAGTAVLAGAGACLWTALFVMLGRISVFLVFAFLPLLGLRGAVAPSLLARAACAPERGLSAFAAARADTQGARSLMFGLALLQCVCVLVLFVNLYALAALSMLLAGGVLGLDVAFIGAFLAPDNEFVLLFLLGLAAVLLEPLHAATSALAFAAARERKEGADLHAAIDALARAPQPPAAALQPAAARGPRSRAAGPLLCALLCCASAVAHAAPEPTAARPGQDAEVRGRVQRILQRHEFRELDTRHDEVSRFWDWLLRLLRKRDEPERDVISAPQYELRLPANVVVLLALVLLIAVLGFVSREVRRALPASSGQPARPASLMPTPRSLDQQLTEAAQLAQSGAYADALRALHGAALLLVARSSGLRFEASRTDGQYLSSLSDGPVRESFAAIAAGFERGWYGRLPVGREEYERCHAAVQSLLRAAAPRSTPPQARA